MADDFGGLRMKYLRLILCAILLSLISTAASQSRTTQIYFKFRIESRDDLYSLGRIIEIDNIVGDTVYAYSVDTRFERFRKLGYDYMVLPNPGSLFSPKMSRTVDEFLEWDSYPSYEVYVATMYRFADNYPDLCQVENVGYSVEGREILFAKLSDNVATEEAEPEVMYSSSMHGDETTGYILTLRLIDYLLSNYGSDNQVTALINNLEIWLNPLANPDGTYFGGNESVFGAIRYNVYWVDLNRNFPDPDEGANPDGRAYQPETLAMMSFFEAHSFIISANFHGGAEVVNYPWDTWPQRHADDNWFIQISREYADSAQSNSPSGYMNDLNNGITNGWDWYTIAGGRQDYISYFKGGRETTIELSSTKLLPPNQLPNLWNYNRAAMLTYFEQAYYGIKGIVTDARTGQPLAATITVLNHDIDSSRVFTDRDVGDYQRMIDAGIYDLRFTAAGYNPQTVNNVSVNDRSVTIVDVQLVSILDPVPTLSQWGLILLSLLLLAMGTAAAVRRKNPAMILR